MKKLKKIAYLFLLLVFATALTVSLIYSRKERSKATCNQINIHFTDDHQFITQKTIENLIKKHLPKINKCLIDTLETDWVEDEIEKLAWVKKADIIKNYKRADSVTLGILNVRITQHTPLFRVQQGEVGYYIGVKKNKLPLSSNHTARVLVVTGSVDREFTEGDLYTFVNFVENNRFWRAQLEQIHVTRHKELFLVPRIGSHLIEFGTIDEMETKFRNMEAMYEQGFDEEGWRKYRTISLKYRNQVVCTLK